MKRMLFIFILSLFISTCYSTRGTKEASEAQLDPQVQLWLLKNNKTDGQEKLAVFVRVSSPLNYAFLTRISEGFYTGKVTKEQLTTLLHDERVIRIRTGKKKLYK